MTDPHQKDVEHMSDNAGQVERLTTKQVNARFPFLQEATLRYWRHIGIGPESVKIGGRVLYRLDRLEQWIEYQENADKRGGAA
ncbi:helix-turn-helix transcriptional regulator [Prescottella equi]|uniref:helix-turn-helix transcriptional regulator n=1 Tax=Rhodococcus hoagii TaxID=43767 RepID=UPI000B0D1123|nr:DNA-binding protein [Prescottella equi]